jgi:hypothetical protein
MSRSLSGRDTHHCRFPATKAHRSTPFPFPFGSLVLEPTPRRPTSLSILPADPPASSDDDLGAEPEDDEDEEEEETRPVGWGVTDRDDDIRRGEIGGEHRGGEASILCIGGRGGGSEGVGRLDEGGTR